MLPHRCDLSHLQNNTGELNRPLFGIDCDDKNLFSLFYLNCDTIYIAYIFYFFYVTPRGGQHKADSSIAPVDLFFNGLQIYTLLLFYKPHLVKLV